MQSRPPIKLTRLDFPRPPRTLELAVRPSLGWMPLKKPRAEVIRTRFIVSRQCSPKMKKLVIDTCVLLDILDEARPRHPSAAKLRDYVRNGGVTIRTPMHALFEISAQMKNPDYRRTMKMSSALTESSPLCLDFVPIDESFFQSYYTSELPYLKGGDLIFLALAHKEKLPLITEDGLLRKKSASIGIQVYSIDEFLSVIAG